MKTLGYDLTFIKNIEGVSGEEVFALGILKGLYDAGKKQQMIVFAPEEFKKSLLKIYPGLHVVGIKKTGKRFYGRKLKKHLRKMPVDVFYYPHIHSRVNVKLKCRTVATVHGLKSKKISRKELRKTNKKLKKIDLLAAVSEFVKNEILIKNKKTPSNAVTVIHNPVADIRQGVDIVLKKKFILSVNSDTAQKNLIAIVKAFNKIQDEIPHDLVIIGTIDEKGRAYRYIKRYGLTNRVIITGRINRDILFGYYRNADLFVNASRYMGFGFTPVEAMACGTKVLTTRIPSIMEIPDVASDGYIKNAHKHSEIANKILIALYKNISKDILEERARKVRAFYSIKKAAEKYIKLMEL